MPIFEPIHPKIIEPGFSIWGVQLHAHDSAHAYNIRDVQKKARLVWFKKFQGVWQIARLKQQRFLSFTFYQIQRSYQRIMCVYFLFHWFSGENCMLLFSLHKGRQTSKELKRNMNDGTIVFLTSSKAVTRGVL